MTLFNKSQIFLGVSINGPMVETCYSEREQTSKDESQAVSCSSLHLEKTVPVVCA